MRTKTQRAPRSKDRQVQTEEIRRLSRAKLSPPFDDERVRKKAVQLVARALAERPRVN
jgi:hypothetical protein